MICSVTDCQKENHNNYPTRCWAHRAKKWAEQKKEDIELIDDEEEIVETDIVPPTPMSPNTPVITAEPAIVESGKSQPEEINSDGYWHEISIYDYKDAKASSKIYDTIWMYRALFDLTKQNGASFNYFECKDHFDLVKAGNICIFYSFFSCSEAERLEAREAGNPIRAAVSLKLAFDSQFARDRFDQIVSELGIKGSIDLILKSNSYDEYLYDLCSLINETWFRDSTNMWKFNRTLYYMQGDSMLYRRTFAAIIASKFGKHFDETRTMTDYDRIGSDKKYKDQGSITMLKSIAGGSDAEGYKAWKAKYDPEPIKVKKVKKTTDDSDSDPESNAEVESRLGGRWVVEAKRICEKTAISYDKLIAGMLKDIEVNGDYCMMDWRDEFIQPINRIVQDAEVPLADFIALAGNWVYKDAEEAAKFAAQIIDPTIVLFANGDVFVRQKLDECEDDGAKRTPSALMKLINIRYFGKNADGEQAIRSCTLDKLMLTYSPMFHRYNRYVSRWDIDASDKGTFGMCAPYRGQMLSDDEYDSNFLDRFFEFVLEVICDNDQEKYKFFLDYCEHSIRFKNAKTGVAMIFYTIEKGCGKGTIMKIFDWVFGGWNTATESGTVSRTVGERNSHILGKKLVMIDELEKANDKASAGLVEKWKNQITEDKIATTPLYSSTIKIDNFTNHMISTNNLGVLHIPSMKDVSDDDDIKAIIRRFCVFKLNTKYKQDIEFFKDFQSYWKTQSFADHFYTYFMKRCELESPAPLRTVISDELRGIVGSQKPAHRILG